MARQGDNYYLVVTDTVTQDSGIYMATASNSDGEAKSYGRLTVNQQVSSSNNGEDQQSTIRTINVENVQSSGSAAASSSSSTTIRSGQPPEFKKLFHDKHAKPGETIRLDAVVLGSPKPKVSLII